MNDLYFIHYKFTNDISHMLIYKIRNIFCLAILPSSLHLLPNSTLPKRAVQVALGYFAKLTLPIAKFTLLNHKVNNAQLSSLRCQVSTFPSCKLHITKATLPNCQVQIHSMDCMNELQVAWAVEFLNFFLVF
jgi:hypothetical protein